MATSNGASSVTLRVPTWTIDVELRSNVATTAAGLGRAAAWKRAHCQGMREDGNVHQIQFHSAVEDGRTAAGTTREMSWRLEFDMSRPAWQRIRTERRQIALRPIEKT